MNRLAAIAPLRHRDFRLFWAGQWISQLGDNLFLVAQVWLIWELTGSGAAMATIALASRMPSIAMLLVGGALVDRLPRRTVSITADLLRGLLLLLLALLAYTGRMQPVHLYLLAGAFGLVSAFAGPAFRALVQALMPSEERLAANALISAGSTVAGIAGPALGGLIVASGGAGLAFLLDGLSFLLAALALLPARPPEPVRSGAAAGRLGVRSLVRDLAEAVRLLSRQRFVLVTMAAMALILVTSQAPVVLLRPWVAGQAGGGVGTLSVSYSLFAGGMFVTATLLGSLKIRRHAEVWIFAGMALTGLAQAATAFVSAPWQMWVLDGVIGSSVMIHGVIWPSLLQDLVPEGAMGRVAAIDQFGTTLLYPAGIALVGLLSDRPGPGWLLTAGGLATVGIAVGALWALSHGRSLASVETQAAD